MLKKIIILVLAASLWSCQPSTQVHDAESASVVTYSEPIEVAHNKKDFLSHQAITYHLTLDFGGKERLNAQISTLTNSTKSKIELSNGEVIYTDHDKVYATSGLTSDPTQRFDAFTWNYFFLLPYKMHDEGGNLAEKDNIPLNGETYNVEQLTFGAGVGDAPDDWYYIFSNPETNLIRGASYIVTMKHTKEEAEADPHAITYSDYQDLDGVPIARAWKFWSWDMENGLKNELGHANVDDLMFSMVDDDFFKPSEDVHEVKL